MRARLSRPPWPAAAVILALALVAPACTGDGSGASPSPVAATPSTTFADGEYRPDAVNRLCAAISRRTLRLFGAKAPHITADRGGTGCTWSDRDSGVDRTLIVGHRVYTPPETRREYSATDEATYRFRRPNGWGAKQTSPVDGFGDEAKLARSLHPTSRYGAVWLVVRHRNVVLDVRVDSESYDPEAHGRMPTYDLLERTAQAAMRDLLGKLTDEQVPARTPRSGDTTDVGDVCRAARSAERLVAGARPVDTSERDSPGSGGCTWSGGDYEPEVIVEVDAFSPSALDAAGGTRIGKQLMYGIDGSKLARRGLGEEAKIDRFSFESGRSRTIEVYVRRGNLLVSVEYERWRHPSRKQMEDDAVGVARDVLAAYR